MLFSVFRSANNVNKDEEMKIGDMIVHAILRLDLVGRDLADYIMKLIGEM